jgi:hypothetical protein
VLIKSGNRIFGKKATKEEITNEIAKMAAAGLSMLEIVEQTGKAWMALEKWVRRERISREWALLP